METSRPWQYAPSAAPGFLRMPTLTAKTTPVATGQLWRPLRETTMSRKMPARTQVHNSRGVPARSRVHTLGQDVPT